MMAGADEPATLSGLCQPMAIAMVREVGFVKPGLDSSRPNGWVDGKVVVAFAAVDSFEQEGRRVSSTG